MKRKIVLLAIALVVSTFLFAVTALAAEAEKAAIPAPKPEPKYLSMTFSKLGGGETTLKGLLKKERTLLVFFQTACIACRTELLTLKQEYADDSKLDVVGVGVDLNSAQVDKFVAEIGFPKTVILDPKFTLGPKVKVTFTPGVVVLDREGQLVAVVGGFTDGTMDKIKSGLK